MSSETIFVIADCHFNDANIIAFENRPYKNVAEMNDKLISNWNNAVGVDDIVIVAGDFIVGGNNAREILLALNGKIKLVIGNHDTNLDAYRDLLYGVYDYPIVIDEFWIVSHYPMYVNIASPYANLFGHVHSNTTYCDVSPRSMCICTERLNDTPILLEEAKRKILNLNQQSVEG